MNITLRTTVSKDLEEIKRRFDADLFRYLLPPGAKLVEFGGSEIGDIVHLKLPLVGTWISEITEQGQSEVEYFFIDEGRALPFPLKSWRHRHALQRVNENTIIEDNMTFSTGNSIVDVLFYPVLLAAFLPRVWQYKSYFKN